MPTVTFHPMGTCVIVEPGVTLLSAAQKAGLPVASSCSADFVCGKCNMQILAGLENLSPQEPAEIRLLTRDKKPTTDRISCWARVLGDCTVTTTYW